jgi:hypothetical protein
MSFTPKQRMLNAYKGIFSDRYPVAPEFWCYQPARILGVDMIQMELEVPHWQALKTSFTKYDVEGWGVGTPDRHPPDLSTHTRVEKINERQVRQITERTFRGKTFTSVRTLDKDEPAWQVEYPVKDETDIPTYINMLLDLDVPFDFNNAVREHRAVGEDYLLEMAIGLPFFDFLATFLGFEKAIFYLMAEDTAVLEGYRQRHTEYLKECVREACKKTTYESFFIGCGYSHNSLLGPKLWRRWDKPGLKAVAEEIHKHGRLMHIHLHGKCMESVPDLAEMGIDCVCPFERPPGGDIEGRQGLTKVRELLKGRVTMNGNVHTVETLIRGTPADVRAQVREIKEVFAGDPRLVIGTGDQVGAGTPEENLLAMFDEAKKPFSMHPR